MDMWLQQLLNAISLGAIYALIALGYTMVYGIIKLINFAHGDVFMVGAFLGYYAMLLVDGTPLGANPLTKLLVALLVAMIGSTLLGVTIERVAYRRLRNSPASRRSPRRSASPSSWNTARSTSGGRRVRSRKPTPPSSPPTSTSSGRRSRWTPWSSS